MSRFPSEFVKKVRDAVDIREIIGQHVVLKKQGSEYVGLCPFHGERSPSFGVNPDKKLFFCHGCKKGGDTITFLQDIHGLEFAEAVEELAERAGISLPQGAESGSPGDLRAREANEKSRLAAKLNRYVAKFYRNLLLSKEGDEPLQYALRRGASPEISESFYLGYAPRQWDRLAQKLAEVKAPLPLARELGLIRTTQRPSGSGDIDFFRDRLIFPILDVRGRIQGFGGRSFDPESPKFLNSSDSFSFHKNQALFGLFQAQKHIRDQDEAIIVEGYFDVIALHRAGFQNAVATCGTALTPEHLQRLTRLASKITILFDGDRAGVQATEKAMEAGLRAGLFLRGAHLPTGVDPDDFVLNGINVNTEGSQKLTLMLANAEPILQTRLRTLSEEALRGAEQKTESLRKASSWLKLITDRLAKQAWLEEASRLLRVSPSLLSQPSALPPVSSPVRSDTKPPKKEMISKRDLVLLYAFVRKKEYPDAWDQATRELPEGLGLEVLWESTPCKNWVVETLPILRKTGEMPKDSDAWAGPDVPQEIRSTLLEALTSSSSRITKEVVARAMGLALSKVWARFSQEIQEALNRAEASGENDKVERLLQEILDVQRKIKEFKRFYDKIDSHEQNRKRGILEQNS